MPIQTRKPWRPANEPVPDRARVRVVSGTPRPSWPPPTAGQDASPHQPISNARVPPSCSVHPPGHHPSPSLPPVDGKVVGRSPHQETECQKQTSSGSKPDSTTSPAT